ncbi:hypothetical protein EMIHUDRAFT_221829 [Emiliania huxleyi CCMP1516]|uniref:Zn(2)-C6 fungal-type domain-containing protein n=2 Tax=Emiliania huxleyi TaxID=2903 RepID=A0A0D3HXG6_EMIH1|nr:hypothetical protein EMIHUDRAFT_221829 [Emiliania huxleyi CCMP1516]EOD03701.1 hypothetical protein EMIHUDRAFT_221829 [Emiliania huxleyi CCMP1516]|eukprot:XP_005756130.1 hypothetical protein EMIHUDRAFT_221829 [Emiliania huxleyi CCMP1516]
MPAVRRYEFGVSLYGEPVGRAAINVECSRADGFQEVENALSRLHNACHDAVSSMQLRSFLRLVCISTTPGPLKEWLGEEAYEQALLVAMLAGMLAPLAAGQGLTAMAQVRVRALALEKLRAGDGSWVLPVTTAALAATCLAADHEVLVEIVSARPPVEESEAAVQSTLLMVLGEVRKRSDDTCSRLAMVHPVLLALLQSNTASCSELVESVAEAGELQLRAKCALDADSHLRRSCDQFRRLRDGIESINKVAVTEGDPLQELDLDKATNKPPASDPDKPPTVARATCDSPPVAVVPAVARLLKTPTKRSSPASSGDQRPKLHACTACQKARTACTDERPCPRCTRLGLLCEGTAKPMRRACAHCKRAKVRCNLNDASPCERCVRLGLDCSARPPPKRPRDEGPKPDPLPADSGLGLAASGVFSVGVDEAELSPISLATLPGGEDFADLLFKVDDFDFDGADVHML